MFWFCAAILSGVVFTSFLNVTPRCQCMLSTGFSGACLFRIVSPIAVCVSITSIVTTCPLISMLSSTLDVAVQQFLSFPLKLLQFFQAYHPHNALYSTWDGIPFFSSIYCLRYSSFHSAKSAVCSIFPSSFTFPF